MEFYNFSLSYENFPLYYPWNRNKSPIFKADLYFPVVVVIPKHWPLLKSKGGMKRGKMLSERSFLLENEIEQHMPNFW